MKKILHCADVHLSAGEKDYSLGVLREIVDTANTEKADFLLFAGDTFDSFDDYESLKGDFSRTIKQAHSECSVLFMTGNHENLGRKNKSLSAQELGISQDCFFDSTTAPFSLHSSGGLEFLVVSHRDDYTGYVDWSVPVKQVKYRICVAHTTIPELVYTGTDDGETTAGVMDTDLFSRFSVDYAALGHIHSERETQYGSVKIVYPGSPRVWRKNEDGVRSVRLVELGESVKVTKKEISSAGQFRYFNVNLSLEGTPDADISQHAKNFNSSDWIWVELAGLIEDRQTVDEYKRSITNVFSGKVRRIDIDDAGVETCSGIASQDIARKFLQLWEARKPATVGDELEVWRRARAVGLGEIKKMFEAQS